MATAAPGGLELSKLVASMTPTLHVETFVFAHIPEASVDVKSELQIRARCSAEMLFRESEGLTLILSKALAEECSLEYVFPCKKITLAVHSSLEAVGFMAVISARLSRAGISTNPVSGFYHDHLFIPVEKADAAVEELRQLALEQK